MKQINRYCQFGLFLTEQISLNFLRLTDLWDYIEAVGFDEFCKVIGLENSDVRINRDVFEKNKT